MFFTTLKTVALAASISLVSASGAITSPTISISNAMPGLQSPEQLLRVGSHAMQNGACFYTRYEYKGDKICYAMGELKRLPNAVRNHFRSVKLLGYARVDLCSRKNLRGKCTTIYQSVRRLPKALADTTYSLEIYKSDGRGYGSGGGYGRDGYDNGGYGGGYGGGSDKDNGYGERDGSGY